MKPLINKIIRRLSVFPISFVICHYPLIILYIIELIIDYKFQIINNITRIILGLNGLAFSIIYI